MSELTHRRRLLVPAICCMSLLIVSIDNTILNVALPSIRQELGASVAGMQWTIDAYTLVLASLLILSGSTADRIGRRRVFKAGLVLFTLGVAAAVASTSRQIGQILGVAVIGAVIAAGVASTSYAQGFVAASRPAWWVITGCGLCVLGIGALTSGAWAQETARRTAERLDERRGPQTSASASA
ncbi:MFS transporter [Streptomyces sp. NBC_01410]|uniref:MFS transporter n=1 Tax=Streptomyces sp. NBC_01410 TaxID=2903856 RepID=UPI003250B680